MKQKYFVSLLGLLAIVAAGVPSAFAADDGFYLGGNIGQARPDFDTGGALAARNAAAGTTLSIDSSATGWKVFGGYQINKYFGAELNYVDLGKYNFSGTIPGTGAYSGSGKINGWGIAGVGTVPLDNNFSLFGKLGAFRSHISGSVTTAGAVFGTGGTDNKWVPQFGIGAKYDFNPNLSIRIEAERFQGMGSNTNTIKTDANLYSTGLSYKF